MADGEHAVVLHVRLTEGEWYGTRAERDQVVELEERLEARLQDAGVGELDGDEFGGEKVVIWMYGPDAERLWEVAEPLVRAFPLRPAFAVLRAGGPDVEGRQVHL